METVDIDDTHGIQQIVKILRRSRSILFITGAGLSADSNLPTYRGIGGLYQGRDTPDHMPIEQLLSEETMGTRPDLVWKYLLDVEKACRGAKPNRGHAVIAEMESAFDRVWVLTQNVDGFHQMAGSKNVIDIHGTLHRLRCTRCPYREPIADYSALVIPPRCPECHGILRPDVVLFGEPLPTRQMKMYKDEMATRFDLVFSIGTTSIFPYISAPVLDAYHFATPSVEINPGDTDVSEFATIRLRLKAAQALDIIWREFRKKA